MDVEELIAEIDSATELAIVGNNNVLIDFNVSVEIAETLERLTAENISLRAERDALAKSISIVSEPIETIQPRGIKE